MSTGHVALARCNTFPTHNVLPLAQLFDLIMTQCCWSPDWAFLSEASAYRPWTKNTGGWVDVETLTSTEVVTLLSAPPFFLQAPEDVDVGRVWQTISTAFGQFHRGNNGYSHFGEEQKLRAYRSDFDSRLGGTHPAIVMAMPDQYFDTSNEGLRRSEELLGRYLIRTDLLQTDTHPEMVEKAVAIGEQLLADDPRRIDPAGQVIASSITVWYDSIITQGGSFNLTTHWLSNHGGLLKTEFSLSWRPLTLHVYFVPIMFMKYSDYRVSVQGFLDRGVEVDWIPRFKASQPSTLETSASTDTGFEDTLNRVYPAPVNVGFFIHINDELFIISVDQSIPEIVHSAVTGYNYDDARVPTWKDFANKDFAVDDQLFRWLYYRPVHQWSPPNGFKFQPSGG